jgi:hypothetical protein
MIKRINIIGALLVSLVFLYGSTATSWVYLSYEINKLEIIEKFCVNKEVEEYTCEGKCHLQAQIDQSEENNPFDNQSQTFQKENITLFRTDLSSLTISYKPHIESLFFLIADNYNYLHSSVNIRPPIS